MGWAGPQESWGEWTVGRGHVVGGWDVGTSPLPDEVHQLLSGSRPLLHAVVQNLKALVLLTLQRMEVETEKGDAKTKQKQKQKHQGCQATGALT